MVRAHAERDRTGTLLAWLAHPAKRGFPIVELQMEQGQHLFTPTAINRHFFRYYIHLYTSTPGAPQGDIERFLSPLELTGLERKMRRNWVGKLHCRRFRVLLRVWPEEKCREPMVCPRSFTPHMRTN